MGWVKSTGELHLDALGNGALALLPQGMRTDSQAGGSSLPSMPTAACMSQDGVRGSSGGSSSVLFVRRFRRSNLGKGDVLQVVQDFPMTCAE